MNILQSIILFTAINLVSLTAFSGETLNENQVDSELKPLLDAFKVEAVKRGFYLNYLHVGMHIVDDVPQIRSEDEAPGSVTTLAQCTTGGLVFDDEIIVSRQFWEEASSAGRESVVFHELGHCLLHEDHRNKEMLLGKTRIPISMMHRYVPGSAVYRTFRDYYVDELFENAAFDVVAAYYRPKGLSDKCAPLKRCPTFPAE